MPPAPYTDVLARNLRAARAAANISQADVGARMRGLGFAEWRRQTVGNAEKGSDKKGRRRLTAEEVFWLAYVLETSVTRLMSPTEDDHWIAAPNGRPIHAQHGMQRMRSTGDGAIQWDGNTPVFMVERRGMVDDPANEGLFPPDPGQAEDGAA